MEQTRHVVRAAIAGVDWERVRTRMFGVSEPGPATSFGRRAVEAKVRTAEREQLDARTAAPNGRPTASRIAILCGFVVLGLRSVADKCDSGW